MPDRRRLEHPLPPGMRDLLPEEAEDRRSLSRAILDRLALHGYRLVTPPAFELASVLERGLGLGHGLRGGPAEGLFGAEHDDLLRFIEPDSGEVAVLRPDMTPQVARIVATRLGDRTPPFRLAYEGTVIRRRSSRAKKHRQIPQVGVELFGDAGGGAPGQDDLEMLCLAAEVLREVAGVERFTIDLSDAGIVRELLADVPPELARDVTRALARKDEPTLVELSAELGAETSSRVRALAHLHGGREAIVEATALLRGTRAEGPTARLLSLFDGAAERGLGAHLSADPGEVRSYAYYTGTIFSIYAPGPGEPLGGGGRYDDLLARYGTPHPAIGFGLDLDALAWALAEQARSKTDGSEAPRTASGVVIVGRATDPRAAELRSRGIPAVVAPDAETARAYAASWGFAWVCSDETSADDVARMLKARPLAEARSRGA